MPKGNVVVKTVFSMQRLTGLELPHRLIGKLYQVANCLNGRSDALRPLRQCVCAQCLYKPVCKKVPQYTHDYPLLYASFAAREDDKNKQFSTGVDICACAYLL